MHCKLIQNSYAIIIINPSFYKAYIMQVFSDVKLTLARMKTKCGKNCIFVKISDMKKTVVILIFSLAVFIFNSCGPDKQKGNTADSDNNLLPVSGNVMIEGSEILYPLMNKWKQEFEKSQKDTKIALNTSGVGKCFMHLDENKIQIAMVARELSEKEAQAGYWAVPVAKDAVLPVISFDNNNLQKIVFTGVTKAKLADVFTGKISSWGQLLQLTSNDPIEVYTMADSSETTITWAEFLNKTPENIKGSVVYSEKDMCQKVAANKNAIGFCSMTNVFDINTGFKKKNLYVMPVDLNADNMADDNELVFDKLDDIKSAISSGKYPTPPTRKLYLVCKTKPIDKATVSFIKWVLTIGQSYCSQFGFVNIDKNETSVYLKQLN